MVSPKQAFTFFCRYTVIAHDRFAIFYKMSDGDLTFA